MKNLSLLLVFIGIEAACIHSSYGQSGILTTIAGNGSYGFSGDGGAATAATLNQPFGIAVDGSGNVYIADNTNNVIRKVNAAGFISTVAGNNTAGYSGDGGPATAASLNAPYAVAVDLWGNIYIADGHNQRIRKVDECGIIYTIAGNGKGGYSGDGGHATSARFSYPVGVAVDSRGNVYIADGNNQRVRMVNVWGTITTVAGTGSSGYYEEGKLATAAKLTRISGIAIDRLDNLYIAEVGNYCIRKVNTSGVISTVAGNGKPGYSGDRGAATAASMNSGEGVAVDNFGNIYIADRWNNRVRKVNSEGVINTIAGDGRAGNRGDHRYAIDAEFYYPWAVAADTGGNLYITDPTNGRVCRVQDAASLPTLRETSAYSEFTIYPTPVSEAVGFRTGGTTKNAPGTGPAVRQNAKCSITNLDLSVLPAGCMMLTSLR